MQTYDLIMLALLAGAMLFGAWKGLAWQVASLAAIVASYFVALKFRDTVASMIHTEPPWNVFLAMLILYVGTSFVIWIAFRLVSGFIDRLKLKEFDRQVGALFGLAKGVVLCVIVTLFAVTLLGETQREHIINSRSGHYIAVLLDKANAVMPQEIHDVIQPYLNPLDEQLKQAKNGQGGQPANRDGSRFPFRVSISAGSEGTTATIPISTENIPSLLGSGQPLLGSGQPLLGSGQPLLGSGQPEEGPNGSSFSTPFLPPTEDSQERQLVPVRELLQAFGKGVASPEDSQ